MVALHYQACYTLARPWVRNRLQMRNWKTVIHVHLQFMVELEQQVWT